MATTSTQTQCHDSNTAGDAYDQAIERFYGKADTASSQDELGINGYALGLARFIKHCQTPLTVALQGGWGTGKTTLFNLVDQQLPHGEDQPIRVIKLETWPVATISQDEMLSLALMSYLDSQIVPTGTESRVDGALSKLRVGRLLRRGLVKAASVGGEFVTHSGNAGDALGDAVGGFLDTVLGEDDAARQQPDAARAFEEQTRIYEQAKQLREAFEDDLAAAGIERLVVFVDDLDRLNPRVAVELLEGIKNFMECKRCVFVLAIDEEVVFEGIKDKYGDSLGAERQQLFFDKIIQVPFRLPVERYDLEHYLTKQLGSDAQQQARDFSTIISTLCRTDDPHLAHPNNPRAIKRYLNLFCLYLEIFGAREAEPNDAAAKGPGHRASFIEDRATQNCLFALIVFRLRYPAEFDALVQGCLDLPLESQLEELVVDPLCPAPYVQLDQWARNGGSEDRYFLLESVLEQVILGESIALGKCVNLWSKTDPRWNEVKAAKPTINQRMRRDATLVERAEGSKDDRITDEGKRMGLLLSQWSGADEDTQYVTVGPRAACEDSWFQRYVKGLYPTIFGTD